MHVQILTKWELLVIISYRQLIYENMTRSHDTDQELTKHILCLHRGSASRKHNTAFKVLGVLEYHLLPKSFSSFTNASKNLASKNPILRSTPFVSIQQFSLKTTASFATRISL